MTVKAQTIARILRHPRVARAQWEESLYSVTLKRGWRDCGITTGEHVIIDNTVSAVMRAIRESVPCGCEECATTNQQTTGEKEREGSDAN